MTKFVGIDYSIGGPSMTILSDDNSFEKSKIYFLTSIKKYADNWGNITGQLHNESYKNNIERYSNNADYFVDKLDTDCFVTIEDYALGIMQRGLIFNLAECTSILKYKLYTKNIPFKVISPSDVKKRFTSSGKSDKLKMYDAFFERTNNDLKAKIGYMKDKIESPVSDIVDSFAISLCGKGVI